MNILMVGGTGTISSAISAKLAADPANRLYILTRGSGQHLDTLPDSVRRIRGDYRTEGEKIAKELDEIIAVEGKFDCVAHFFIFNEQDARKAYEIFRGRTRQFIYISTNVVIDHTVTCRISESCKTGNTLSTYGKEKREAEEFLLGVSGEDFPVTSVRPSHTYSREKLPLGVGGNSTWATISRMRAGKPVIIIGDGQSIWPTTHAEDFAEWFVPIVGNQDTVGEIYHIMNPQPQTWDEIYRTLADELGVEYKPVYISAYLLGKSKTFSGLHDGIVGDKMYSNIFDCSKVQALNPGFTAKVTLRDGIRKYLAYVEDHPEFKAEDPEWDAWCDRTIAEYQTMTEALEW